MRAVIQESGELLGERIKEASSFLARLRGLMLTDRLPEGQGLHIRPCRSVHCFFMNYPIDVLHLDRNGKIVGIEPELRPGKIGVTFRKTHSVVELPAGTLRKVGAAVGQTVLFERADKQD